MLNGRTRAPRCPQRLGRQSRPLDASVSQTYQAAAVPRATAPKAPDPGSVRAVRLTQAWERKGAFALLEIPMDLLALFRIPREVPDVLVDLERHGERIAKAIEPTEPPVVAVGDKAPSRGGSKKLC
jgi:hypothetical protein